MAIRIYAASYLASPVRTGRESILTTDTSPDNEERMAETLFKQMGNTYGSRAQTALRFALSNQDISTAIIGLAETQHLEEAIEAASLGQLPPQAMTALETLYENGFAGA